MIHTKADGCEIARWMRELENEILAIGGTMSDEAVEWRECTVNFSNGRSTDAWETPRAPGLAVLAGRLTGNPWHSFVVVHRASGRIIAGRWTIHMPLRTLGQAKAFALAIAPLASWTRPYDELGLGHATAIDDAIDDAMRALQARWEQGL